MNRKIKVIMIASLAAVAVLTLVLLLMLDRGFAGATSSEASANAELERRAERMDVAVQEVLDVVDAAGMETIAARGRVEESGGMSGTRYCLQYRAGITVATLTTDAEDFVALEAQFLASGWTRSNVAMSDSADHPGARFERDGIEVDVLTGGFTSGGVRYGADEVAMSVQRNGEDCVYVPDFDRVTAAKERFGKAIYPGS